MSSSSRTRLLALATVTLLAAAFTPAARAGAGVTDLKTFTVTINGTTAGATPSAYSGDTNATINVRIANTGTSQSLNSANVTLPAPFSLVSSADDAVAGGPTVELRNLNITPGSFRDFPMTVDVQTCVPSTPDPFTVNAKQSNDYNGTGNDFFIDAGSDLQVNTVGTCSLAFVTQPTNAERNTAITGVAFTPTGTKISAEVRDGGNTGRATHSTATIGLTAFNASVTNPVIGGTSSATAVAGLATFTPGPTLSVSSAGYTFRASSTGLTTSSASSSFTIVDDQVNCPAGNSCNNTGTATKGQQTVSATFGTGANGANLLVSIDAADAPAFQCAGYTRPAGTYVSQYEFVGGDASDRLGTFSSVIPNASKPLNNYQVCWAAPYPFTVLGGGQATVQGTKPGTSDALYVGLLPDCAKRGTRIPPCVSSRTYDRATNSATITVYATGADPWRY